MSAREAKYFRHLRLGDIGRIYPAVAETLTMGRSGLTVLAEYSSTS